MFRFYAGLILTMLLLLIGHWFPWPVKLHRLCAYVYGCVCILLGAAVWLLGEQPALWRGLCGLTAGAGLATGAGYLIDWILNLWQRKRAADHERHPG